MNFRHFHSLASVLITLGLLVGVATGTSSSALIAIGETK